MIGLKKISKLASILLIISFMIGCTSTLENEAETEPEELIKVSREIPMGNCEEIGLLRGTTMTVRGLEQNTLEDLKQTAIGKGANYLQIIEYSETETSSTGLAFMCD